MATVFLFGDLDNELLVVRDGEFLQGEHRPFGRLAMHHRHIVLGAERLKYLLLHGGSLYDLLVHDLEAHIIDVKGNVRGILQFRVKVEKPIVGMDGFQKYYCPLNFKDSKNVWLER